MLPALTATALLSYSTFLFDLDGVLQNGHRNVIPNAPDIVNFLYKNNKEVYFVSNNDWESPENRVVSFHQMGFTEVKPDNFINPLRVALEYFKENGLANKTMYVLAPQNVKNALRNELGINVVEGIQRIIEKWDFTDLEAEMQKEVDAVIMDSFLTFTNENIAQAVNYLIRNPKIQFFSFSSDESFRGRHRLLIPDAGSYRMIVERVSGRKAVGMGKPSAALNDFLKKHIGVGHKKAIMFGDNLTTDIIMANQAGIDSCLMLTGVHGIVDVDAAAKSEELDKIPKFHGNFTELVEELKI